MGVHGVATPVARDPDPGQGIGASWPFGDDDADHLSERFAVIALADGEEVNTLGAETTGGGRRNLSQVYFDVKEQRIGRGARS
ncbi:hypothetical protein GCM10022224_034420 [Nonomuraea antimicrobica]|uniref:Uncharacterized protein n=1 Tax=Nonomuraea antimicrobica TaxID=561173 RepID=A0ABP7BSQ9_9ACTN